MTRQRSGRTELSLLAAIAIVPAVVAVLTYRHASGTGQQKLTRLLLDQTHAMLRTGESAGVTGGLPADPTAAPGPVSDGAGDRTGPAIVQTANVLSRLRAAPAVDAALKQLPADHVWTTATRLAGRRAPNPVVLDGWGNPMIYVPAGGLTGVRTAAGMVTVRSPDARPFFASAGPDRSFAEGDDNQYSFPPSGPGDPPPANSR